MDREFGGEFPDQLDPSTMRSAEDVDDLSNRLAGYASPETCATSTAR